MNPLAHHSSELHPATVVASVVSGFTSFADDQGIDIEEILDRSSLNPELIVDPNRQIPLHSFLNVLDTTARMTDNDNIGLWLGNQFRPEYLGLWGYIALSSATLRDALTNMTRYFPYFQRQSELKLSPYRGQLLLEYDLFDRSIVSRRQDAELTLGTIRNVIRRALGEHWGPIEVHFSHPKPENWQDHSKAFQSEILFGQPSTGIVLSPTELGRVMSGADPHLLQMLMQSIEVLLHPDLGQIRITDRVQAEIVKNIHLGLPRLENVADRLVIPHWTLSRQLKDEGQSYSSLVEQVRRELACHYLTQTSMSVSELAGRLGYAETSSFSHAFSRWFGMPPRQWRRLQE